MAGHGTMRPAPHSNSPTALSNHFKLTLIHTVPWAFDSAVSRRHTLYNFPTFPAEWRPQGLTRADTRGSTKVNLQITLTKKTIGDLKESLYNVMEYFDSQKYKITFRGGSSYCWLYYSGWICMYSGTVWGPQRRYAKFSRKETSWWP